MLSKNEVIERLNSHDDFTTWPKLEMLHGAVVLDVGRVHAPEFTGWVWAKVAFVDSVRLFNEELAQSIHRSDITKFAPPAVMDKAALIAHLQSDPAFTKWPDDLDSYGNVKACVEPDGWFWRYHLNLANDVVITLRSRDVEFEEVHESNVPLTPTKPMTKWELVEHLQNDPEFTEWPSGPEWASDQCDSPDGWFWYTGINKFTVLQSHASSGEHVTEHDVFHDIHVGQPKAMTKHEAIEHLQNDHAFNEWPRLDPDHLNEPIREDAPHGWAWVVKLRGVVRLERRIARPMNFDDIIRENDIFTPDEDTTPRLTIRGVVYIAGPMTGLPDFNRPAFADRVNVLHAIGYESILSPHILPDGLTQAQYMDICLAMVRCADTVVMLEGWKNSPGAIIEHDLALKSGKRIEYCS